MPIAKAGSEHEEEAAEPREEEVEVLVEEEVVKVEVAQGRAEPPRFARSSSWKSRTFYSVVRLSGPDPEVVQPTPTTLICPHPAPMASPEDPLRPGKVTCAASPT